MRKTTTRGALLVTLALCACGDDTGTGGSGAGGPTGAGPAGGAATGGQAQGGQAQGGQGGAVATGGAGGAATGGTGGTGGNGTGGSATGGGGSSANGGAGGAVTGGGGTGGAGGGISVLDQDQDGDGWTPNQGDCCDVPGTPTCDEPVKVNPGAFEALANGVDDDCDPATSDVMPVADCSPAALVTPTSALDLVKAMDLCQFTTESPALPDKIWGVIDATLTLADGSSTPLDLQRGVLAGYGSFVTPKKGATMASISSGTARKEGDAGYVHPQNGSMVGQIGNFNASTSVSAPPGYLAAHGGVLPNPPQCPACNGMGCATAFDSARLRVRIRVPTNAQSFSYNLKFYSAEFPEYVCNSFNDFFVTLLTSSWVPDPNDPNQVPLPFDRNIATDSQGNTLSVNNAFLDVCFPPVNAPPGSCPEGTLDLVGNGMGGWGGNLKDGGGTAWLTNEAPVVPGETIELEFITWDAGDHNVDSLALLDKFKWQLDPANVGLHK